MPYTPPAQKSPVASQASTPPRKLSNSTTITTQTATKTQDDDSQSHWSRPNLPRSNSSQSYLHKHRRSPSLSKHTSEFSSQPTAENGLSLRTRNATESEDSVTVPDQSTLSKLNGRPTGSNSPPSSSDEDTISRGRYRKVNNMEELQAAIRGIEQNRRGSPAPPEERKRTEMARDFSKPYLEHAANVNGSEAPPRPLAESARKISHSRSTTDTNTLFNFASNQFDSPQRSGSDEDLDDDDLSIKPSLIRKKSGELVRPALRGHRRPSSMPGTPTYNKAVHFQEHGLEHVRTFLQVDRPIAVSAGSSPVGTCDEDDEFPFSDSDGASSPTYEWELKVTNFPRDTMHRQMKPVRVERIYLSADTKTMYGSVAVRNLSFHKLIVARFTLDYWKTTSEVVAEYSHDIRKTQAFDGCDRFVFEIKLDAHANLESKTMFFCVRYQVGGIEYWDNNDSINYQVDFGKKTKAGIVNKDTRSVRHRNTLPPQQPRPRSMPSFDDFGNNSAPFDFGSFPQPNAMIGESPIRFKNRPIGKDVVPDAPAPKTKNSNSQQAFGNRYDFGASLSAAAKAKSSPPRELLPPFQESKPSLAAETKNISGSQTASVPKPTALTSEKPSLHTPSYNELIDKYCFFGSGKSSSSHPRALSALKAQPTQTDGTDGSSTPTIETSCASNHSGHKPVPSPPSPRSPIIEKRLASTKTSSPRTSRSVSPVTGGSAMTSRSHSPGFGYPYHHGMQGNNLFDTPAPTAIQG